MSQLISGKAPVTKDIAAQLAKILGGTKNFWLTREANYRAQLNNK